MSKILIFAKSQTVDVELAGVERNRKGRIINDNADCRQNRYEHAENTILFVTLYQTTISASTPFSEVYELIKGLVCVEWGFEDYVDIKLIRDIGSVWSFYLTLTTEDYVMDYVYTTNTECEVLQ